MTAETATAPDPLDLEELYSEHRDEVFRYILRRCGGRPEVAEDLTHDAFVKFARWAQGRTWVERGRPVVCMLYTTARSITCDWWKRGWVRHETPVEGFHGDPIHRDDPAEPEVAALAAVDNDRWRGVLEAAMADLSDRQQDVLRLAYVEGLLQREIAIKLDMTEGAVKAVTYRAMRALRADPRVRELADER